MMPRQNLLRLISLVILPMCCSLAMAQASGPRPAYLRRELPVDQRVEDLLSRMTVEEKVAQLQCSSRSFGNGDRVAGVGIGGIGPILRPLAEADAAAEAVRIQNFMREKTRLGIPALIHDEALHGLVGNGATSFPQSISLASTWDPELLGHIARAIGTETRARGIRQVLAPVINIAGDPRWGRVEETYGEDPFLTSAMGVAYCSGLKAEGIIATPKHFAANFGDGGRDSYPIQFSERLLREIELPAFLACVRDGGAGSVMAAYNSLDGAPCAANPWLLTHVLRGDFGFKGFVVSDYGAVGGIEDLHHLTSTHQETAAKALNAGLDVELPDVYIFGTPLLDAVRKGLVQPAVLDNAVRRVLREKFAVGLFDDPVVPPNNPSQEGAAEHRALALQAAREGIVLLRNEGSLLPLPGDLKEIAVIGPRANDTELGDYSGTGARVVTILEGIRKHAGASCVVTYARGCDFGFTSLPPIPKENLLTPDGKEHGLRGEYFNNQELKGKPTLTRIDREVLFDWGMDSPDTALIPPDHFSARWTGLLAPSVSGTYRIGASSDDGVRLKIDGKLLIDSWVDRGATLDAVTMKFEAGRKYRVEMEYYENEGYAYAALVWRRLEDPDTMMETAVNIARRASVAIVVPGIIEGEGYDRADLDLPAPQEDLIRRVAATGTPTIAVLVNGSAVTMKGWSGDVRAVLEPWYSGEEGGNAVADVLFGTYNPAGRLPVTFPRYVGQVPLTYNHKPTGRGDDYGDMSGRPLYPFGFGLSYTSFAYNNLRLAPSRISPGDTCTVSVEITNTGSKGGDEVAQLYIHRKAASVVRPVKELKGFRRISLAPGETKTVRFVLGPRDLEYLNDRMETVEEAGAFDVLVGASSSDIRSQSTLEIIDKRVHE